MGLEPWIYTWDAENRLVKQESVSALPTAGKRRLEFAYDYQGRRIQKLISTNSGSSYVAQCTNHFIYDGWNLLAELSPSHSAFRTYVWGLDLSGSEQGAGGMGGLLMLTDQSTINNAPSTHFVCHDGNKLHDLCACGCSEIDVIFVRNAKDKESDIPVYHNFKYSCKKGKKR